MSSKPFDIANADERLRGEDRQVFHVLLQIDAMLDPSKDAPPVPVKQWSICVALRWEDKHGQPIKTKASRALRRLMRFGYLERGPVSAKAQTYRLGPRVVTRV